MKKTLLIATLIASTFTSAQDSLITSVNEDPYVKKGNYNPLSPPNTYQNADNPNYWKNKMPHAAYWQQDVYYNIKARIDEETDIIIVDSYGESLKFYNISKNVFVGKSLAKNLATNSGQNPIEPARLGCKIFHGPNISNFKEIYSFLKTIKATKEVKNLEELSLSLVEEFRDGKEKNDEISTKLQNYGQNIFNNVIIELKKYI